MSLKIEAVKKRPGEERKSRVRGQSVNSCRPIS